MFARATRHCMLPQIKAILTCETCANSYLPIRLCDQPPVLFYNFLDVSRLAGHRIRAGIQGPMPVGHAIRERRRPPGGGAALLCPLLRGAYAGHPCLRKRRVSTFSCPGGLFRQGRRRAQHHRPGIGGDNRRGGGGTGGSRLVFLLAPSHSWHKPQRPDHRS